MKLAADILRRGDTLHEEAPARRRTDTLHEGALPARRSDTLHDAARGRGDTVHEGPANPKALLRKTPRFPVQRPVLAIPLLADGTPDLEHRRSGTTVDLSLEGIGIVLDAPVDLHVPSLVVVLADEEAHGRCAGIEVRYTARTKQGRLRLGGRFGGFAHELLRPEKLTPSFNPNSYQFALGYPEEVLDKWAGIGVLSPVSWDRVQVCPRCRCLPSFRPGCQNCGSAWLVNDPLIHHFACAHVGHVADFEAGGELCCPKCRTRRLVVGADFEYLTGPFRCRDCHWTAGEREHVAQCLRCGLRFPGHQAFEQELKGYRAHRLDPLALLPAPGPAAGAAGRPAADGRPPVRPE